MPPDIPAADEEFQRKMTSSTEQITLERLHGGCLETRLEIKRLGRHRPEELEITQKGKSQNRTFQANTWFDREPWLTACPEKKALFCFPCILFGSGGAGAWTKSGITDLQHLSDRVKSHKNSTGHKTCCLQLKMMGNVDIGTQLDDGYRHAIRRHNQTVDKNRHILGKIIDCIKFCGGFELALRGHDETEDSSNPGVFRGLVDFVAEIDNIMADHLEHSTIFKGTSKTIQNELLDTMYEVYLDEMKNEIKQANFISIQADETTDVSCKCQMVTVLRYTLNGQIKERFVSFTEAKLKTADALTNILLGVLCQFSVKEKLIAQTYDGAATMKGRVNGVQAQVKEEYPNAHFVHCYAHQLNLVMEQACSKHSRLCKVFFANLSAFAVFFSLSPKRAAALKDYCKRRIPRAAATRWNFNSRTVSVVYENVDALKQFFQSIADGDTSDDEADEPEVHYDWDDKTIREATGLLKWLEDEEFLFFLEFFHLIMPEVDLLYNTLQRRNVSVDTVYSDLRKFIGSIEDARSKVDDITSLDEPAQKRRRTAGRIEQVKAACKEACDTIIVQAKDRFESVGHIVALQLVDPREFARYAANFPSEKLPLVSEFYGMISVEQLRTELSILYKRDDFQNAKTSLDLYQFILENDLNVQVFPEVSRLLEISLTTPLVSVESERCFSTLNRIQTFLRNTMTNQRLNALAFLSIQKDMIRQEIPTFNQKVIYKFATSKTRRADFCTKPLPD
ncbi:zinc finger MYM-type protein 1-like [Amphiura filiformis]|uniref:zinc finger MYM-type protein 1-like n=1 Tax=Amphiura filiformis TaxID=82378 RepID=UPI003B2189C1